MKINRNNRILFAVILILSGRLRREAERKKTCTDDEFAVTDCPVINSETQNNSTASGRTMDQSGRDHTSEQKSDGENRISETGKMSMFLRGLPLISGRWSLQSGWIRRVGGDRSR